jgi:subtilisin family serine protease
MPSSPSPRRSARDAAPPGPAGTRNAREQAPPPGFTGRQLVLLAEDDRDAGVRALESAAGLRIARSGDYRRKPLLAALDEADGLVLDGIGIAIVNTPPDGVRALTAGGPAILAVEPERIVQALPDGTVGIPADPADPGPGAALPSAEYLRGYRDGIADLARRLLGEPASAVEAPMDDEAELTWGLQATRAGFSTWTGRGVGVAVLDTGLDLAHPDLAGREVRAASFVAGEGPEDGHGHGTHCIGTACGGPAPRQLPRYGAAGGAVILVGKVLDDRGRGEDGGILAGIDWALTQAAAVVSMSLGAPVRPGDQHSAVFEQVAQRALKRGVLLVAAAGNESRRPHEIRPVGHPANCPSILAVGAVDRALQVAPFSCAGLDPDGGQVDLAAPGVAVRSSWPSPELYRTLNGTSMATPHVAGIAALLAEAEPSARGYALWARFVQGARRLPLPARDVGAGLVQAP